jgi:hypothetical protein
LAGEKFRDIAAALDCPLSTTHKAWCRFRAQVKMAGLMDDGEIEEEIGLAQLGSGRALEPAEVAIDREVSVGED